MKIAVNLLSGEKKPQNWVEELTRYLAASFISIHQTNNEVNIELINTELLKEIIDEWYHRVEEIMAHVFDFLYFYRKNVDKYIASIWLSWSVIPNISHRIEAYVLRTLCAVLTCHLRREESEMDDTSTSAEDETYRQVCRCIEDLSVKEPDVPYLKEALDCLRRKWENSLRDQLLARKSIVLIVRSFLYSDYAAANLFREQHVSGGQQSEKDGYDKQSGLFDDRGIDNPIGFMSAYATDSAPSSARALWMLCNVSFNSKWK